MTAEDVHATGSFMVRDGTDVDPLLIEERFTEKAGS